MFKEKIEKFYYEHKDAIDVVAFAGGVFAVYGGLIYLSCKLSNGASPAPIVYSPTVTKTIVEDDYDIWETVREGIKSEGYSIDDMELNDGGTNGYVNLYGVKIKDIPHAVATIRRLVNEATDAGLTGEDEVYLSIDWEKGDKL